jgi:chromosome segregation ATPase
VKTHIQHAAVRLTDSVGEVNERLCDARNRYETNKERKRSANEEIESGDENEELQLLAEKERQVDDVTGRMEVQMRQIIDSENRLSELTESVRSIEREEAEAQTAALGVRQTRGQRRMRRQQRDDDEEGEEDLEDEDYEGTPEREIREHNAQNPPSRRLEDKLVNGAQEWGGLSLTER